MNIAIKVSNTQMPVDCNIISNTQCTHGSSSTCNKCNISKKTTICNKHSTYLATCGACNGTLKQIKCNKQHIHSDNCCK